MNIAIYHNLEKGGALNFIIEVLKYLKKNNNIDIYCFQKNIPDKLVNKFYVYKTKKTNNIISNLKHIVFNLKKINQKIALKINKNNYDLVLVFPCLLTQSPYILRFLKNKQKTIYFFTEPKREFYEITSFNYFSPVKIVKTLIRLPLKFIDKKNCQSATHIISNSFFTSTNLERIYRKKSTVIYPGLKQIVPRKITIQNNKKLLSVGQISKLKGHDFSIKQIINMTDNITILGRETEESKTIYNIATKNGIFLNILKTENDKTKNDLYKYYSIYLANNYNEPFGITTLEATINNCLVLGKNSGGTPEIIQNGMNGYLYSDLNEARKILNTIMSKKIINLYQTNIIDWKYTSDKILDFYYTHIKHEHQN